MQRMMIIGLHIRLFVAFLGTSNKCYEKYKLQLLHIGGKNTEKKDFQSLKVLVVFQTTYETPIRASKTGFLIFIEFEKERKWKNY